jgi:hypothetical protein
MIDLHIKFRSRTAGSFGRTPVGRLGEWVTATWFRFTCLLFTGIFVLVVLASSMTANERLIAIAASPLLAILSWYCLLLCILLSAHLGIVGKVLSRVLVLYFYLFSRLVVQPPPGVDLRLTE